MKKIFTYSFTDNFLEKIAKFCKEEFYDNNIDPSKIAIVFGGRRPSLFLNRELARIMKKPFLSFRFFSIDSFMEYLAKKKFPFFKSISDLEATFFIYQLVKEHIPQFLEGRSFGDFFFWGKEILRFFEELDLEFKDSSSLQRIEEAARIGYDTFKGVNQLLSRISSLREYFHRRMMEEKKITRGYTYFLATSFIEEIELEEFQYIIFCGFFYLYKTEKIIFKTLLQRNKAILFFQKDKKEWKFFQRLEKELNIILTLPSFQKENSPKIRLYSVFDDHAEVATVREILKEIKDLDDTVIVLPNPDNLIPLISEISSFAGDFNVSLGYPLKRSALFSLLKDIIDAQLSLRDDFYYVRDYLKVLIHPFIKNIKFYGYPYTATRILIHKIEEYVLGMEESEIEKRIFFALDEIEGIEEIYSSAKDILEGIDIKIKKDELKSILSTLHRILFVNFEKISTISEFISNLEQLFDFLIHKSLVGLYPFNLEVIKEILELLRQIKEVFPEEITFKKEEVFKLFLNILEDRVISFKGSPLKGLQVLGVFEVRDLHFKNVIFMDLNETVYPDIKIETPLIPREVLLSLGIDRLEREEEILRYHFRRLIEGAENVYLIYQETQEKERSRFIEEIVWEKEKEKKKLDVLVPQRSAFKVDVISGKEVVKKSNKIVKFLEEEFTFSATSLDVYLRCPLRFYYHYVLGLKEKEEILEEAESKEIGDFIHTLLEAFFKRFLGKKPIVDSKSKKTFFDIFEKNFHLTFERTMRIDSFLLKEVLRYRLEKFIDKESKRDIKKILFLEKEFKGKVDINGKSINIVGKIDRVDINGPQEEVLIIDYKTGSTPLIPKIKDIPTSFGRKELKKKIVSFQLPLYYYLMSTQFPNHLINACLYYLKDLKLEYLFKKETKQQRLEILDSYFLPALRSVLEEILNPEIPFEPDPEEDYCFTCSFSCLCKS